MYLKTDIMSSHMNIYNNHCHNKKEKTRSVLSERLNVHTLYDKCNSISTVIAFGTKADEAAVFIITCTFDVSIIYVFSFYYLKG